MYVSCASVIWKKCTSFISYHELSFLPYTQVNKRMRLFSKLQGNMRLIPNMRLIAKVKIDHTFKTMMSSLVARVLYSKWVV